MTPSPLCAALAGVMVGSLVVGALLNSAIADRVHLLGDQVNAVGRIRMAVVHTGTGAPVDDFDTISATAAATYPSLKAVAQDFHVAVMNNRNNHTAATYQHAVEVGMRVIAAADKASSVLTYQASVQIVQICWTIIAVAAIITGMQIFWWAGTTTNAQVLPVVEQQQGGWMEDEWKRRGREHAQLASIVFAGFCALTLLAIPTDFNAWAGALLFVSSFVLAVLAVQAGRRRPRCTHAAWRNIANPMLLGIHLCFTLHAVLDLQGSLAIGSVGAMARNAIMRIICNTMWMDVHWYVILIQTASSAVAIPLAAMGSGQAVDVNMTTLFVAVGLTMVLHCRMRDTAIERQERAQQKEAKAKQGLLAAMRRTAHDIGTPLTAAKLAAEQPQITQESMHTIRVGIDTAIAQRTMALVQFALDAGNTPAADNHPVDMRAVVSDVTELVDQQARQAEVQLAVDVAPSIAASVLTNPKYLVCILLNLVSNAVKYAETAVHVAVDVAPPDRMRLEVTDDGMGIDPEDCAQLWEPFGLRSVKDLTTLLGGTCGVDGHGGFRGRGAKFWVVMPYVTNDTGRETKHQPGLRLTPEVRARFPSARVLVVEDSPSLRRMVVHQLNQIVGTVLGAPDGAVALRMWRVQHPPFDLIITDLNMPRMDGLQLAGAVRQAEANTGRARTPMLMLTANAPTQENQNEARRAGLDDCRSKPMTAPDMHRWVAMALGST